MLNQLLIEVRKCTACLATLPNHPNPVLSVSSKNRILIIGQAPGQKAHQSNTPWNDPSGDELRRWLGVDKNEFYNTEVFGLMPMGFCYPGKGKSGDIAPREECAPLWHSKLRSLMPEVQLTLLIGHYAHKYYLPEGGGKTLTENVKNYRFYLPSYLPLVHPSPRNRRWKKNNLWFEQEIVPLLQTEVKRIRKDN